MHKVYYITEKCSLFLPGDKVAPCSMMNHLFRLNHNSTKESGLFPTYVTGQKQQGQMSAFFLPSRRSLLNSVIETALCGKAPEKCNIPRVLS